MLVKGAPDDRRSTKTRFEGLQDFLFWFCIVSLSFISVFRYIMLYFCLFWVFFPECGSWWFCSVRCGNSLTILKSWATKKKCFKSTEPLAFRDDLSWPKFYTNGKNFLLHTIHCIHNFTTSNNGKFAVGSCISRKAWFPTSGGGLTHFGWIFVILRKSRFWQINGHVKIQVEIESSTLVYFRFVCKDWLWSNSK